MNKIDFLEVLRNGENSKVEFKNVNVSAGKLAIEVVSFLNHEGGYIFLGVEDDHTLSGVTTDKNLEEWVANICRDKIYPPTNPTLLWIRDVEPDKDVLAIDIAPGINKPYAYIKNKNEEYCIRVGSTVRIASREELQRLFLTSGQLNYGLKPVPGTDINSLDLRRISEYFNRILGDESLSWDDTSEWEPLLRNINLMTEYRGQSVATIDGLLLFGKKPKRFLPQSGIRALCYPGTDRDYATRADEYLKGPMVSLKVLNGTLVEPGLAEQPGIS